jgi:SM-20-related protein
LNWAEQLRTDLNRTLYLGLDGFESHFAHYPPGAFYRKHVDAFKDSGNRVLSLVVYLNPDWSPVDGGQLVLYDHAGSELGRFPPTMGTVAVFFSERFPHEVLTTTRDRYSIAGWFRRREEFPVSVPP